MKVQLTYTIILVSVYNTVYICMHCKVITTVSLLIICHHTKLIQYY